MQVDGLKRFMLPAAVTVLALVGLSMVLEVIQFGITLAGAQPELDDRRWSPFGSGPALLLAAVIGVAAVWGGRAARSLAVAGVVLCAVGLLLQLGAAVLTLTGDAAGSAEPLGMQIVRELAQLVLPVLALLWLVKLRGAVAGVPATEQPALPQQPSGPPTTWQADHAAGAHWPTAAGAASGAAASDWGRPGERGGWVPPAPALEAAPSAPETQPPGPPRPAHQPLNPQQFGPQALAEQFGGPNLEPDTDMNTAKNTDTNTDQTVVAPQGRRQPPQWTPLDRDDGS